MIKALQRQLKDRNVRTRQGCFNLFTELAGVLPGSLAEHMAVLVSGTLGFSWLSSLWASSRIQTLPYLEPSIPESPAVVLGLLCVMMAHGGWVLSCTPPHPTHNPWLRGKQGCFQASGESRSVGCLA